MFHNHRSLTAFVFFWLSKDFEDVERVAKIAILGHQRLFRPQAVPQHPPVPSLRESYCTQHLLNIVPDVSQFQHDSSVVTCHSRPWDCSRVKEFRLDVVPRLRGPDSRCLNVHRQIPRHSLTESDYFTFSDQSV
jgi:hypothetical protein